MSEPGRVALVTGAAGGIGGAVVDELSERGWEVVATDLEGTSLTLDVTSPESIAAAVQHVRDRHRNLHALVCCAGVFLRDSALRFDESRFRRTLAVNLEGPLRCTAAFGRLMGAGGRIVHVASIAGERGTALASAYSASKAGLIAAARSAARELAPKAITVNVVAPGPCDTGMVEPERASMERWTVPRIPMRRLASPEEVAATVAFLVTGPEYLTGSVITVDGGLTVG